MAKTDKAIGLVTCFEQERPGGLAMLAGYVGEKRPYAFDWLES